MGLLRVAKASKCLVFKGLTRAGGVSVFCGCESGECVPYVGKQSISGVTE
jgi:hypothetical protein